MEIHAGGALTFERMHKVLLEMVRERVRNGEITESGLARLTGVSQPHIHNVLKGVRILSTELADEILRELSVSAGEVFAAGMDSGTSGVRSIGVMEGALGPGMQGFDPERICGRTFVPSEVVGSLREAVAAQLADDPAGAPRFAAGDIVLIDYGLQARKHFEKSAVYVVMAEDGPRLRYVRQGDGRLYLISEQTVQRPAKWESVQVDPSNFADTVRGRVIWVSRQMGPAGHIPDQSR